MEKYLKIRRLILNSNLFPKQSYKELSKKICILLNNDINRIDSYKKNKNIGNDTNITRQRYSNNN